MRTVSKEHEMSKASSYLRAGVFTAINILVYVGTFGRTLWLEGRVSGGKFRNWIRGYVYRPQEYLQPETEEEIIAAVQRARRLRVAGSGHSFNSGIVGETLLSLDRYSGVLWTDRDQKQIAVKGGTRVRDVVKVLRNHGWALKAQPSHDAQSIGGILSTDVHGTGRDWGFVSESVVSLKVIDGRGFVHSCTPTDDLFKAAIGGVGAVGIISEVVIQAVERFRVAQRTEVFCLADVEERIEQLLDANDHLSLYVFPFTDQCQVNT